MCPVDEFVQAYSDVVVNLERHDTSAYRISPGTNWSRRYGKRRTLGARRFDCVQPKYNLLMRDPERELFPVCAEYGIGVIPYSPQAGGFLLGKHRNYQAESGGRFSDEFRASGWYRGDYWSDPMFDAMEKIIAIGETLRRFGERTGIALGDQQPGCDLVYRWCTNRGAIEVEFGGVGGRRAARSA